MMEKEPISDRTELQTQLLVAAYSRLIYLLFQERSLFYKMTKEEKSKWDLLTDKGRGTTMTDILKHQIEKSLIDEQLANSPYREILSNIPKHSLAGSNVHYDCFTLEKNGQFFTAHHFLKNPAEEIVGGYFFSFRIPQNFFAFEFSCEYSGITFITIEPGSSSDFFCSLNASDKKSLLSSFGAKVLRWPHEIMRSIKKEGPLESLDEEPEVLEVNENWAICLVCPDYESDPTKVIYQFLPPLIIFHEGDQFNFKNVFYLDQVPTPSR